MPPLCTPLPLYFLLSPLWYPHSSHAVTCSVAWLLSLWHSARLWHIVGTQNVLRDFIFTVELLILLCLAPTQWENTSLLCCLSRCHVLPDFPSLLSLLTPPCCCFFCTPRPGWMSSVFLSPLPPFSHKYHYPGPWRSCLFPGWWLCLCVCFPAFQSHPPKSILLYAVARLIWRKLWTWPRLQKRLKERPGVFCAVCMRRQ